MTEHLHGLTMARFIELSCGDTSVLLHKGEVVSPAKVTSAARRIIFEYRAIADVAGARAYLSSADELMKAKAALVLFKMCHNLVALGEHEGARDVLVAYGINAARMSDHRLAAEVTSRLERARATIAKHEQDNEAAKIEPSELRASFDTQTAAMMAHFKFQIDVSTMKATLYAHLVARYNREIKAQMSTLRKR